VVNSCRGSQASKPVRRNCALRRFEFNIIVSSRHIPSDQRNANASPLLTGYAYRSEIKIEHPSAADEQRFGYPKSRGRRRELPYNETLAQNFQRAKKQRWGADIDLRIERRATIFGRLIAVVGGKKRHCVEFLPLRHSNYRTLNKLNRFEGLGKRAPRSDNRGRLLAHD
jgi:hypothetical protein